MLTLALESSGDVNSIALIGSQKILSTHQWKRDDSSSEWLTSHIEALLKEACLSFKEVEQIAVGLGPGRFTGVRVSVNAAKAFSYALNVPIVGVDSLTLLAQNAPESELPLLVLVNAHKNKLYFANYQYQRNGWLPQQPVEAIAIDQVASLIKSPTLCLGDGVELLPKTCQLFIQNSELPKHPLASTFYRILFAEQPSLDGRAFDPFIRTYDWESLQPLYIRNIYSEYNNASCV